MFAVEFIKLPVVGGVMFRPVPPVPITALSNQEFFKSQFSLRLSDIWSDLRKKLASMIKIIPRSIILGSADQDIEVSVDPGTGHQRRQFFRLPATFYRFGNRQRLDARITLQSVAEAAQKFTPGLWIVFPGVFSIVNDRDHRVLAFAQDRLGCFFD